MTTEITKSLIPDDQKTTAPGVDPATGEIPTPEMDSDITPSELELLDNAGTEEDDNLIDDQRLDDTDEEGDELNEADDLTGADLDVPGTDTDDADESIGEEDEENNNYSLSDQDDGEEVDDPIL